MTWKSFFNWPYWVLLFIAINLFFPQQGNPNPGSRLATLAEMSETGRFEIDRYVISAAPWTNDWSQNAEGQFYSNKAPGPMLLGYPLFWITDQFVVRGLSTVEERTAERRRRLPLYNQVLSILLQVVPFAIFLSLLLSIPVTVRSASSQVWAALAILFGNTVALLMNTYFGHGMAAMWLLVMAAGFLRDKWLWVGLGLGMAVLSDYAILCFIPPVLAVVLLIPERRPERLKEFGLGVAVPLILWSWYHTVCFGRPWRIALMYQSPEFKDLATQPTALWGIVNVLPNFSTLGQLVWGWSRGILVTQPWVLLAVPFIAWSIKREKDARWRALSIVSLVGFGLLLWLNSGFGGWHGGRTIGPRYLSPAFPLLGLLAAHFYDDGRPAVRIGLWVLLAPALLLAICVFSTTLYTTPGLPLWPQILP